MSRSIAGICGVPFRRITGHKERPQDKWSESQYGRIELLSCGHSTLCKDYPEHACCAKQRRCYTCKREGYESPKNRKIRLRNEQLDKECEPFLDKSQHKK